MEETTQIAVKPTAQEGALLSFTQEQIQAMKDTVAKGATDAEFVMYLALVNKYQLDPFAREIWFIKDKQGKPMIQVAKDGFLKVAQRDSRFLGIQGSAVYANETFEIDYDTCTVTHKPLLKERGALVGAWCKVKKDGMDPYIAWAEFAEYSRGKPGFGPWKDLPSVMIQKVATTIALRATFGITGVYAPEEIVDTIVDIPKTPATKTTKKPLTNTAKNEAITAEVVTEEEEVQIEEITEAQVTMIHTIWSDITELKGWDPDMSDKMYRENLKNAAKVESSKDLSKAKASLYIEYLTTSLDKIAEKIDNEKKEENKKVLTPDEAEAFLNS